MFFELLEKEMFLRRGCLRGEEGFRGDTFWGFVYPHEKVSACGGVLVR